MKKLVLLSLLLSATIAIAACGTENNFAQPENSALNDSQTEISAVTESFNYQDYDEVLKTYVDARGLVDYQGLQANREQLDRFNRSIGEVTPEVYSRWSDEAKLAFLINAYNSFTLQSIIDQNPLKQSIRQIPGVWRRRKFAIAQSKKTLDNIEHDIIRQDFNEPRIHAALVCAAISCPPLRNEPYLSEKLEAQLEDQTIKWIASPQGFKLDRQKNQVFLSAIFKWFGEDWITSYKSEQKFTGNKKERAVLNFISQYLTPEDSQYLAQGNYQIKYSDYDWSLNKQN